jgi:hypothetical protein
MRMVGAAGAMMCLDDLKGREVSWGGVAG